MRLFALVLWLCFAVSCTSVGLFGDDEIVSGGPPSYLGAIPRRAKGAPKGSVFIRRLEGLSPEQREAAILHELRTGNIPAFLRRLHPVALTAVVGGKTLHGTVWVMPDYLAVGDDDDWVYVPMNPLTAQRVADHFGFVLPTKKLVDEIYAQGGLRLVPTPMPAGASMASTAYFQRHDATIKDQLHGRSAQGGDVVVGHKKDVVLTNRLCQQRRRVAIYGWHREPGKPIQPLSLVHGELYADYSHGIRLVAHTMQVEGVDRPVAEVLQDPRDAALLSDEGPLRQVRIATDCSGC